MFSSVAGKFQNADRKNIMTQTSGSATTGLGVAAYIQLTGGTGGSALSNPSGGTLAHPGSNGGNGQGIGATAGGTFPVAQYALTLSVSGAGTYETTANLTAELFDVQNNPYVPSDLDQFTAISYNNPSAGSPSWYRPSNFAGYSPDVASVSASGISGSTAGIAVTALNPGQAIVEVAFATFDNTLGNTAQPPADQPVMKIYVQVVVTVIP
jgi:hypothetical protein